jgi:hypothetical protein
MEAHQKSVHFGFEKFTDFIALIELFKSTRRSLKADFPKQTMDAAVLLFNWPLWKKKARRCTTD